MRNYLSSWFNERLVTSAKAGIARLQVDVAETGFFDGREFRISQELDIPNGETLVMRFSSPVDFILQQQTVSVDDGSLRFRAYRDSQGTPGGTFEPVEMYGANTMSDAPDYTRQAEVASGGTFTPDGGEEAVETIRLATATITAFRSSVTGAVGDQRGLAAGDYYLLFENTGTGSVAGVFDLKWEERP